MKTKITNIRSIFTWSPLENQFIDKENVEILIEDNTIIEINNLVGNAEIEIDADNAIITPGFIDSHSHLIFS